MSEHDPLAGSLPLTTAQKALWASQLLHPNTPLYNMAFTFTIEGPVAVSSFRAAFQHLIDDADSMRTIVDSNDGVPFQRVLPRLDFELPFFDLSTRQDPIAAAELWAQERTGRAIDLSNRSFDSALLRLGDDLYVWYLNQHHVVSDAASFAVLFARMGELYVAAKADGEKPPNSLSAYADYVTYERSLDDASAMSSPLGNPDSIAPALYGIRPKAASTANQRVSVDITGARSQQLRELALRQGVRALTPDLGLFQLFATAFLAYLHRVSGQTAIAIGAPIHNRSTASFKRSSGLFMEVYPLGVEIDEDDTFSSLYDKVRSATANLMRSAKPGQSSTEFNRGINAVLNYITARFDSFDGSPVTARWLHSDHVDAHHHLRLQVHDFSGAGSFTVALDCSTAVFSDDLRSVMPKHFAAVIGAMVDDWEQPVAAVEMLVDPERTKVLGAVNRQQAADPEQRNVVKMFLDQAAATPDSVAIAQGNDTWSFADVARLTGAAAADIEAGTVVGVALPRSPEAVLSMLAALRAGASYLPIDPSWPAERIKYLVDDAQCSLVISDRELDVGVPTARFADLADGTREVDRAIDDSGLAYILYTSGSTGRPKGVMIDHRALANYVGWASRFYDRGRRLAFPLFTPLTFDLTITSVFVPLVSGGSIRVYPETAAQADLAVLAVLEEDMVDIVKLTPSHLALLPERGPAAVRIGQLILGGEDLTVATARRAYDRFAGQVVIHNEYGPTEATVGCIVHTFDPSNDTEGSVPIGQPIDGMRAYVLDRDRNPVPFGVPGELYVAGTGVARGYVGRDDPTAERFVAAKAVGEERAYATGDLASVKPSGTIEYLGRRDDQVKIRGVRVELGEIDAAVASHPDVVATAANIWTNEISKPEGLVFCVRCGLASDYPGVSFNSERVCSECTAFADYQDRAQIYFKPEEQLASILRSGRSSGGEYDCLSLLSGGKDSTYVLCRLVDMGLKVLAFTLDNGYISEEAKENIQRVVTTLGVDHMFASTPAMNEIFVDSLQRHANVCHGCFKTIYTLSMQTAREKRIPFIVTGLSRGQFFETRLTEELFTELSVTSDQIDASVLEARKAYHRIDDAAKRLLDVSVFDDDTVFDKVRYVDFYRYVDVDLTELYAYLDRRVPWVRPSDTGRSTNCLINDVGIYYHRKVRGYHNYALPYSWDVRMGHKTREAALDELDDEIDVAEVARILDEIGFPGDIEDYESGQRLVSYYVSPVEIPTPVLKSHVAATLPRQVVPTQFVRLDSIPLTSNGKVDKRALPLPEDHRRPVDTTFVAATTDTEIALVEVWEQVLGIDGLGVRDNYFDLGGDSIMAIQIEVRANRVGIPMTLRQLFDSLTIEALARVVDASSEPALDPPAKLDLPEIPAGELSQLASVLKELEKGS